MRNFLCISLNFHAMSVRIIFLRGSICSKPTQKRTYRPSDKSGFYFQAETLFPRDCWQREAVQSPGEQHRGVARAVQEESQVHDAWRLVSAGTSSIVRSFLWFLICVMTSGEAGHEEHVPGVRHGETLHPRHVPLPGARHLHRHRPHLPQVCPIWHLSCPFSGVLI